METSTEQQEEWGPRDREEVWRAIGLGWWHQEAEGEGGRM